MEDQVREILDQEDASEQRRVLSSKSSFERWLDRLGLLADIIRALINVYDLYMRVRRYFGH